MKNLRSVIIAAAAFVATACGVNQESPVTVVVYPISQRCAVKIQDKGEEVECIQLGTHLRDTLKIGANRQIDVSLTGADPTSKDDKTIDRVAELIRASGFKDVRVWRFGM